MYQLLKRIDYSSMNRGSTQSLITQADLKKTSILLPDTSTLTKFEETASTLMKKVEENIIENIKLMNQ